MQPVASHQKPWRPPLEASIHTPSPTFALSNLPSTPSPPHADEGSPDQEKTTKRACTAGGGSAARKETEPPREHSSTIEENDQVMAPHEVRGLPKCAPAATNEKGSYNWPDPLAPPKDIDEDPHRKQSRKGVPPPKTPTSRVTYTDATFQCVYVSKDVLLGGLAQHQMDWINKDPLNVLAILPHSAGAATLRDQPKLNRLVLEFMKTFRFADNSQPSTTNDEALDTIIETGTPNQIAAALLALDNKNPHTKDVQIFMPVPANGKTFSRDKFAKLWALLMVGGTADLMAFLLWQQTFTVSKTLTFNILKLEDSAPSWVLCNYSGDCVDPVNADVIMTTIKCTLWLDDAFRAYVFTTLHHMGLLGNINNYVVHATESLTLTFFDNTDDFCQLATVVQLRGCPQIKR